MTEIQKYRVTLPEDIHSNGKEHLGDFLRQKFPIDWNTSHHRGGNVGMHTIPLATMVITQTCKFFCQVTCLQHCI